ncbi:MAG: hypothetical protein WD226_12655 [Planctomycetota bacterium]
MIVRPALLATAGLLSLAAGADELEQRLRASNKWVRKSAVEALVKLGDEASLVRLVGLLGDPAGEVADTAEWGLVRAGAALDGAAERFPAAVVDALDGRDGLGAKDEWVRRRAWGVARAAPQALGAELGARAWRRGLGDGDVEVRVSALGAVERLARQDASALAAIETAVRRGIAGARRAREAPVAAAALFAEVAVDASAARSSWDAAAEDRRPEVLAAAARTALAVGAAPATLVRFLDGAAAAVIEASDALSLAEAAPLLVACLDEERPLALRTRAWRRLVLRSGWRHGLNSPAWEAWLENPIACPTEPRETAAHASTAVAAYDPPSDRVVFLVDLSGSVWREREDGTRPRDDLVASTAAIVSRLPETTRFDVGVFTGAMEFAAGELVAATRARRRSAERFLEDASLQGPGDVWSAMLRALQDPEVDTLVILTDGEPTGGRRHRLELLAEVWGVRTRVRPVALEVLLIDAPPRVHRGWQAIVAEGGGRVLDAVLRDG